MESGTVLDRRSFLKFLGVGASAGVVAATAPGWLKEAHAEPENVRHVEFESVEAQGTQWISFTTSTADADNPAFIYNVLDIAKKRLPDGYRLVNIDKHGGTQIGPSRKDNQVFVDTLWERE